MWELPLWNGVHTIMETIPESMGRDYCNLWMNASSFDIPGLTRNPDSFPISVPKIVFDRPEGAVILAYPRGSQPLSF
jgi:hypothetical protein